MHCSIMVFSDDEIGYGKTKTCADPHRFGGKKRLKNPFARSLIHTRTIILYLHAHHICIFFM